MRIVLILACMPAVYFMLLATLHDTDYEPWCIFCRLSKRKASSDTAEEKNHE